MDYNHLSKEELIKLLEKNDKDKIATSKEKDFEKELRDSQSLFQSLLKASPNNITITDLKGHIEFISQTGLEMFGYGSMEEIQGKSIFEYVIPEDRERAFENLKSSFFQKMEPREYRVFKKDGSIFHVEVNSDFNYDENGNPYQMILVARDITDKVDSQEKLRLSDLRYKSLFEKNKSVMLIIDPETGKICEANISACEYYGWSNEELTSMNINQINTLPDYQIRQEMEAARQERRKMFNFIHLRADGILRNVEVYSGPVYDKDKILLYSIIHDVTDRVRAEEENKKLSLTIEQSPSAVMITDTDGIIEYVNPSFVEYTGYSKEEAVGQNPRFLKSDLNDPSIYEDMWKTIKSGKVWKGEWINKKKNQETYWENQSIFPIFDLAGEIKQFVAIKLDITEKKLIEKEIFELNASLEKKVELRTNELNLAIDRANQANEAKSEFLSRMSHELRTPMNSVLGYAQLLDMGELNEYQRKCVKTILQGGKHLLDLINEVLDISRIESGNISLNLEPVHVCSLISEVISVIQPLTIPQNIELIFESCRNQGYLIHSDKHRVKQILINLLNNAIKYNKANGKVQLEILPSPDALNFLRFKVSDTGKGISKENLERIFQPFDRVGIDENSIEGTGLGLTVVKKLTEALGGTVGVESILGTGSTFYIDLPIEITANLKKDPDPQTKDVINKGEEKGCVLYIEDNVSNVDLLDNLLLTFLPNIELHSYVSGKNIFKYVEKHRPFLILLDLNLPEMHGSEVLKLLKDNPDTKNIPVVIISADVLYTGMDDLIRAGAQKTISKPFDVKDLLNIIQSKMH